MPFTPPPEVQFVMIDPARLKSSGKINHAVNVVYIYPLERTTKEEVLSHTGEDLARFLGEHAPAVKSVAYRGGPPAAEMWENPRTLARGNHVISYYYCGVCGTPLKPGKCKGKGRDSRANKVRACGATIIDVPETRENLAPPLPGFVYRQLTWVNRPGDGVKEMEGQPRYRFQIVPVIID